MKKKIFLILLILIILIISFYGCDNFSYKGNDIQLHTIARSSILGLTGIDSDQVKVLETDDYGRKLYFIYSSGVIYNNENGRILSLMISQKTTETNSYFYEDVNYLLYPKFVSGAIEDINKFFTKEQIQELKDVNDWNKEIKEDKLFEIDKENEEVNKRSYKKFDDLFKPYYRYTFLTKDKNKNSIYFIKAFNNDELQGYYLIFIDKDGTFNEEKGKMEIKDPFNFKDDLIKFKEQNNWNK